MTYISIWYPSQGWQTIRDVMEGFGLGGPWASLQDFSVGPALLLLLVLNSLVVGGWGGHAGDGNPLPSQALLLRGPTVEDTAGLQEASQSWKGESLPHNVALRLQLFPALPFPGQQTP